MRRFVSLALFGVVLAAAAAAEDLLKPVAGPGAGSSVEGLQAAVRAVKEDFGPGESILIQWTLTNNAPREHALNLDGDRRSFSLFSFEARRNGETVSVVRRLDKPEKEFAWVQKTLAPATKLDLWIDLRGLAWADPRWLDTRGAYEVCVIYRGADVGQEIRSGWASFRVAAPGGVAAVALTPQELEQIRTLIAQLGAEDFEKREAAQARLVEFGEKAVGPLTDALQTHDDLETRQRCQQVLDRLAQLRTQRHTAWPLCPECMNKSFTADVGRCTNCGGNTPSGSWRYCRECAPRLGRCAACGRMLNAPPPPPPPLPQPLPPQPKPQPPPPPPQPKPQPLPPVPQPPPDDF